MQLEHLSDSPGRSGLNRAFEVGDGLSSVKSKILGPHLRTPKPDSLGRGHGTMFASNKLPMILNHIFGDIDLICALPGIDQGREMSVIKIMPKQNIPD